MLLLLRLVTRQARGRGSRLGRITLAMGLAFAALVACSSSTDTTQIPDGGASDATVVTCSAGEILCGTACVEPSRDSANCGACGKKCATGEACAQGACALACGGGTTSCGGVCADTKVDPSNCGGCAKVCAPGLLCSSGKCGLTCAAGYSACGGDGGPAFCASTATDNANCGSCGHACGTGHACVNGACLTTCSPGLTPCVPDGGVADAGASCVDVTTDDANCGTCGNVCGSGKSCQNGQCKPNCVPPSTTCNGSCVNVSVDPQNCGACGTACPSGFGCCAGACRNYKTDVQNCGSCGQACTMPNATPKCTQGMCGIAACNAGFMDCNNNPLDGCEVNVFSNPSNCGACGLVCMTPNATPKCTQGMCGIAACNPGFGDCNNNPVDGCEVNLLSNPSNCGTCGLVCMTPNATPKCTQGMCGIATCNPGFVDCNLNPADGCEVNVLSDPQNCGVCGLTCIPGHQCIAGVCN